MLLHFLCLPVHIETDDAEKCDDGDKQNNDAYRPWPNTMTIMNTAMR